MYPRAKNPVAYIVSIGYVVKNQDDGLALSTSIADNSASLDPVTIPWGSIRGVEVIPNMARLGQAKAEVRA